jgi:putative Mn2+ efflux pump MntP
MTANLGLLYGLDNAAVALALGPLLGWRRGLVLALLFAAAEMLMPLAGAALALPPFGAEDAIRAGLLGLTGTTIAGLLLVRRDPAALVGSPAAMVGLAILLGLDNLVAGAGMQAAGFSAAHIATVGIVSGALSAAACLIGVLAARPFDRRRAGLLSSAALLALAGLSLVG